LQLTARASPDCRGKNSALPHASEGLTGEHIGKSLEHEVTHHQRADGFDVVDGLPG